MLSKIPFFFFTLLFINFGNAQVLNEPAGGGEYVFNENKKPCLTDAQREVVKVDIKKGIQELKLQNRLAFNEARRRGSHPLFIWPVKKKDGLEYNDVWAISNYVDQNPAFPNQILDYDCGARTYDTTGGYNHAGIDIFTWPFTWKMMDNDEVEVIAAAPGQIIYKYNSSSDRSCNFNNDFWNTVYIQHTDGSAALYGHMKQNSLTTKNVGDMVAEGEYLGIVGSSGNSTGPHLHFEVYSEIEWNGVGQDILVDPYAGACNSMNGDSWWQIQKPYNNPNINAALTHSAPPIFPACPTQEITNENDTFGDGETVYLAVYLRDQVAGSALNLKVLRPDGSTYTTWDFDLVDNYSASYWYWTVTTPSISGNWTWQVSYLGQAVNHNFTIGSLSIDENDFNQTSIYPNPFNDIINIKTNSKIINVEVIDILGKTIRDITNDTEGISTLSLENLSNGIYFLSLKNDLNQNKTIKILKE